MGTATDSARPTSKGKGTRTRILDVAEEAVLAKGFDATSIEELVAGAGITRSGFFYHFPDKNALARALIERYIAQDRIVLDDIFGRAAELSDDPLHRLLIALRLFAEILADLPNGHPGCMVATIAYQDRLFDAEVRALNREAILSWRRLFLAHLERIAERYPPREPVDLAALADMVSSVIEGGIVVSRALREPRVLGQHVMLQRSYIKLLFAPTA